MGCQSSVLAKEAPLPTYNNETALALLNPKERKAAMNAVDGALVPTVDEADDIDADFDINTIQRRPPRWLIMVDRCEKDLSALSTSTQSASSDPTAISMHPTGYSVERVSVKSVLNGNTFVLYDGRRVRLAGVAVPQKGEPYYKKAKRLLEHFILGQWVYLEKEADAAVPDFEFTTPIEENFRESMARKFRSRRKARKIAKRNKATQNMLQREEAQRLAMLEMHRKRHEGSPNTSLKETSSPTRRRPPPGEEDGPVSAPSSPLKRQRAQEPFGDSIENTQPATVSARTVPNSSPTSPAAQMPKKSSKHKRAASAPAESAPVQLPPIVYLRTAYTVINGEKGYMNLNAAVVAYGFGTVLLEDGSNGHEVPQWMQIAAANKVKEESEARKSDYLRALQQGKVSVLPKRRQAPRNLKMPDLLSPLDPTQNSPAQQVLLVSPTHSTNTIDPARPPYTYPSNRALLLDCLRNAIVFPLGRWVNEEQLLAKVYIPINESPDRKYLHHKGCPGLSGASEIKHTTLRRALVMGRSPCPKCKESINNDCKRLSERKAEKERLAQEKERERRARFKQMLLDEYEEKKREMQLERQREMERRNPTSAGRVNNDSTPVS